MPPSLIRLIDNHMVTIQENNNRDNTKFHPSTVGKCARQTVYTMLQYPTPLIEPRTMRIFQNGHSMHERFEHWFGEIGIQIAPELALSPSSPDPEIAARCAEFNISGRTDSLIVIDDELFLVELKSANEDMFKYKLKEGKQEHIEQLQLYMYLTGVHRGFLLYEAKNSQELKEFYYDYDEFLVSKLIRKIGMINTHVASHTFPDKENKPSDWQCRYCDHRTLCHYPDSVEGKAIIAEYHRRQTIKKAQSN